MADQNWIVFVVPILNMFLLLGGIARLVWHAGKLEQSVQNLIQWQQHMAKELDDLAKDHVVHGQDIGRIKGHLNLNGGTKA